MIGSQPGVITGLTALSLFPMRRLEIFQLFIKHSGNSPVVQPENHMYQNKSLSECR